MSQWNNTYAYNNQYQGYGDPNCQQYVNQTYYANRADPSNQYVSFNEFLSQMQSNGGGNAANASNYNNVQYENYPSRQYNYQNAPSTSQNPQNNSYGYASTSSNAPDGADTYQMNVQSQYNSALPESNSYPNEMILKSNLTATATEFVPKSTSVKPSSSTQNIPKQEAKIQNGGNENRNNYNRTNDSRNHYNNMSESRNTHGSSSDSNWRERPQSSQQNSDVPRSESSHIPQEVQRSQEPNNRSRNRNNESNRRQYEKGKRYQESSAQQEHSTKESKAQQEPPAQDPPQENSRQYNAGSSNQDSKHYNNSTSPNQETSDQYYESSNQEDSGNRHYNSNNRNYESNSRYKDSNGRNAESSSRGESNGRYNDSGYRNSDSNSRNYDSNRYDSSNKRGQNKVNYKSKNKDADNRTFYNSAMGKDSQDVRGSRGEGSGRYKGYVGSQRLRAVERNSTEDEQYANTYLQREEKIERDRERKEKSEYVPSPNRFRKQHVNNDQQVHSEMTQRERLSEQLDKGTLECLVCCERVKQTEPVWSCSNCYHVLHLRCIRKWAMSSMVEGKWRCPACQNTNEAIPTDYRCMCGAVRAPEYQRGAAGAHTCGRACRRTRACPHPCTLLCHPGPCPPCQATVTKQCGCGAETRSVLCSSKLAQVCGRVCKRALECKVHTCTKDCHEGPCETCSEMVTQVCHCPAGTARSVACTAESGGAGAWSCGGACGRVLACGAHVCRARCHPAPCPPCALLPRSLLTCPCGKNKLAPESRKTCTDPIPLCGNICAKPLPCGPAGDKHFCKLDCHEGPCPVCPDKTVVQCRCGHSSREVPCADLPDMLNNVLCQKKCNKKLSCGRHRCRTVCCAATSHRCAVVCGRSLACQAHRCEEFCHTGHCAPCPRVSFEELTCECGAEVVLPPVRCGTRPPACSAPCTRIRACRHAPHHACHSGDCPPCVVLTTKRCHGDHEERKTIPCSQEEFSCGLPCGKPLPCGKHTCIKTCHKGPCDTGKCTQPCTEKRAACGHACAAACHFGAAPGSSAAACPSAAPCRATVRATCPCRRRHADRYCADNQRDLAKMMSALAATKIQEGGSVDLSDVQRPGNMLKTLECDDECRVEARTRQLALALQIRNPDVSAKLAPRYSEHVRATAAREPAFAQLVHDKLTDLVQLAKKSKQKTRAHSFPSMNWQKRQFIHELCEHFGCESVAYDAEPNRNVVATADKEKSWLPAMSVLEVLAREAGKRRVPGPVLRAPAPSAAPATHSAGAAPPATSKSSGGWATLTSTNAWAARSQPKQPPQPAPAQPAPEKIDYFDNPPDN
ncbi:nuclear transcription factor, X-box binding stc [Anticarsia gemmatalis]|uniref:nuclear transcription factor, X-box binding stc n=1 Tax=Anticarsia gemmatalis TaxID=129554 RepID=UPI003F75C175